MVYERVVAIDRRYPRDGQVAADFAEVLVFASQHRQAEGAVMVWRKGLELGKRLSGFGSMLVRAVVLAGIMVMPVMGMAGIAVISYRNRHQADERSRQAGDGNCGNVSDLVQGSAPGVGAPLARVT